MEGAAVRAYMRMKEHVMKGGSEHRVALWRGTRVLKDLAVQAQATESLFDYLTDHLLANHLFGDDVCLEGFFEDDRMLHIVVSQPLVVGRHPVWRELVEGLSRQGLILENPGSKLPVFNVIVAKEGGFIHPIDAHFYFDDQAARIDALKRLGILGP
ncbi:hypothetical protein SAMN02745166_02230 [Prosthecobacter debontii]|uniref:Uncharacterized protein n=2 Tax=Prosthecobacter debontii TaxID=48467 RepID=A0A1T4XZ94_9BACT|nr:hypothetical protein SAMN02745166_02230 [Prosthecobacter debontii]